ncbi:E3 ubiquitin-protein ligase RDUF2-like [Primulina huaijiensis]|uniref:E3 ubiquitin-protein ligase RDUF2-like n=1 Tax=Primulina huaijiensis TaxID=1492673 RepID=UPI003CC7635A
MASATIPTASGYWCYTCTSTVSVMSTCGNNVTCPHCDGGFIQVVDPTDFSLHPLRRLDYPGLVPTVAVTGCRCLVEPADCTLQPVGVGPPLDKGSGRLIYELYYEDNTSSGLRPLLWTMSES